MKDYQIGDIMTVPFENQMVQVKVFWIPRHPQEHWIFEHPKAHTHDVFKDKFFSIYTGSPINGN